ncbi:MAG: helix-turn-helix transcriptional regulator [Lachnospiraceae bacterium]|nr:helix-turn-helix transcriptional regulator [Lachnospiraceae bacterium]
MDEKTIVRKTLFYIERNLDEDLSLKRIEEELHYSKFYINRLFAKETGCTIYKYIQKRRITEAARQLAGTGKPIAEIAQESHYNSQQAFTLAFRQIYLCTPQEYRRNGIFSPEQPEITIMDCAFMAGSNFLMSGGKIAA